MLQFHPISIKKHPFVLNLPPTHKHIPENLFLRRSSVELEISGFLAFGGFPLYISPLPTVQNSSKVGPFSKSIQTYNFDKSVLFERPVIAYLIYDEKHECFPSQKISHSPARQRW